MLFVYQLKMGICLIGFYLLLKWLLSRETLHRAYRLSLLAAVALSALLPLIPFSTAEPSALGRGLIVIEGVFAEVEGTAADRADSALGLTDIIRFAYIIYIIGVGATLLWHAWSHWRLRQLLRRGRTERQADGTWLHVVPDDGVSPFSYFRHIVISQQDYDDSPREILTHEQAHIRLHHSLDVLLMNLVAAVQWWNPAAWLLRRELQQVHEYEADEAVLKRGVDARQYQLLLIRKSVGNQLFSMANNLNHQSLKKRIRMMTRKRSSRWQQLRLLAVVPVAGLALVAFASPQVKNMESRVEQAVSATELPVTSPADSNWHAQVLPVEPSAAESWHAQTLPLEPKKLQETDTTKVYDMVEQMPEFPGGAQAMMKYLYEIMRYPKEAMDAQQEGRVIVTFVVDAEGWVTEPKVVRSISPSLDNEALRVVNSMPKWTPGMHKGKAVRVKYTLPVAFKLQGNMEKTSETVTQSEVVNMSKWLFLLDGQRATYDQLRKVEPEQIANISIVKDAEGKAKYDAADYEGVMVMTTKK